MTLDKLIVLIGGVGLIGMIYWFFFGKKEEVVIAGDSTDILVDGGYKPSVIKIRKGQKTTLSILRKDPSTCLEEFDLPDFKIRQYLPVGKTVNITFTPEKAGEYRFHCGMNMFHGKVVVE